MDRQLFPMREQLQKLQQKEQDHEQELKLKEQCQAQVESVLGVASLKPQEKEKYVSRLKGMLKRGLTDKKDSKEKDASSRSQSVRSCSSASSRAKSWRKKTWATWIQSQCPQTR